MALKNSSGGFHKLSIVVNIFNNGLGLLGLLEKKAK
jgi:hypothetical protein